MYYTLENFMNYCDDYQIANEGFNFKNIFGKIMKGIKDLLKFIMELPSKLIKYVKSKFAKNKDSKEYQKNVKDVNDLSKKLNEQKSELKDLEKEIESVSSSSDIERVEGEVVDANEKFEDIVNETKDALNSSDVWKEVERSRNDALNNIQNRHEAASKIINDSLKEIYKSSESINKNKKDIDELLGSLKQNDTKKDTAKSSHNRDEIDKMLNDLLKD